MNKDNSSLDTTTPEADPVQEALKGFKAEINRKNENFRKETKNELAALSQSTQAILESIKTLQAPRPSAKQDDDIDDLVYSNPKAFRERVQNEAAAKAAAAVQEQIAQQAQHQQRVTNSIAEVMRDFPELQDENHALTQKSLEIYNAMDPADQRNPMSHKLAVRQAAQELDVKPMKKRPVEDFSGGGSAFSPVRQRKPANKLDENVKVWAELLKVDISDPEVEARLIARQNRYANGQGSGMQEPLTTKKKGKK